MAPTAYPGPFEAPITIGRPILDANLNRAERSASPLGRLKFLLILGSSALLAIAVISRHVAYAYSSDDVGIQNILQSWASGLPMTSVVGVDTFFLKWPLYLAVGSVLENSRTALLVVVLIFAAIQAAAVFGFTLYVHRRIAPGSRAALVVMFLPVAWFYSTQIVVPDVTGSFPALLVPNGRNAEIAGALLVVMAMVALFEVARVRPRVVVVALVASVSFGVLSAHDPYFLYVLGLAAVVTGIVLRAWGKVRTSQLIVLAGGLAVSYTVMTVVDLLLRLAGISTLNNAPNAFIAADRFADGLTYTVSGLMVNFNATLFGRPLNADILPAAVNVALLAAGAWALVASIRRLRTTRDPLTLLLVVATVAVLVIFASTTAAAYTDHRFLYAITFFLLPLIGMSLVDTFSRLQLTRRGFVTATAIVAVAIVVNLGFNVRGIITANLPGAPYAQQGDAAVIAALQANGIEKAYGEYWHATIATYLSAREVIVLPLNCGDDGLTRKNWLTNLPDYDITTSKPTAYVHGPKDNCSLRDVEAIIGGSPSSIVDVPEAGTTILIYERDIGNEFPG